VEFFAMMKRVLLILIKLKIPFRLGQAANQLFNNILTQYNTKMFNHRKVKVIWVEKDAEDIQ
jgi:predicted Na+-dependent transporter